MVSCVQQSGRLLAAFEWGGVGAGDATATVALKISYAHNEPTGLSLVIISKDNEGHAPCTVCAAPVAGLVPS